MMVDRHLFYHGRVQGVGFRYSVKQLAAGYEVTGWVRNLADGRVEMLVRGDPEQVEDFLAAISGSHLRPHIRVQEEGDPVPGNPAATGFEIRH